jgi:hypothetical protein
MDKDTDHSGTRLSPESAHISQVTLDMALSFVQGDAEAICAIVSPFLIHLLYRVASIHLRIAHESPTTAALEKIELLKKAMRIVGSRWLCACKYLLRCCDCSCAHGFLSHVSLAVGKARNFARHAMKKNT